MVGDERGTVCEPLDAAALAGQQNVHVVLTRPGGVRGNHYHRETTEILTVWGPARLCFRQGAGAVREIAVAAEQVRRFRIPPGLAHAIENTGTKDGLLVSFTDQPHDPQRPDVVRAMLIEPTPPEAADPDRRQTG